MVRKIEAIASRSPSEVRVKSKDVAVSSVTKILGQQIAAARGLLRWSQVQLATAADVSQETLVSWERGDREPRRETIEKVRRAIEERGVEFTNGNAPGVRFKPKDETKPPAP